MKWTNCAASCRAIPAAFASGSRFGPAVRRRAAASAAMSPSAREPSSAKSDLDRDPPRLAEAPSCASQLTAARASL